MVVANFRADGDGATRKACRKTPEDDIEQAWQDLLQMNHRGRNRRIGKDPRDWRSNKARENIC
jgi:hypothetical protein